MKIHVFTIRNKVTNELIYAEGNEGHMEYFSSFKLEEKWLNDSEIKGSWIKRGNYCYFDEEIRHILNYQYEKIKFSMEQVDIY